MSRPRIYSDEERIERQRLATKKYYSKHKEELKEKQEQKIKDAYFAGIDDLAECFRNPYVYDLICRDDCSRDKLMDIVDKFARQMKNIKEGNYDFDDLV